jgi:hypothetical protein
VGTFNVGNGGKDQRSRHNDSYQAETQFAHPNPVPRQAVKALRSNASAKASSLVRSRTVANRSVHPSIATTPPTGSNDASFEEF